MPRVGAIAGGHVRLTRKGVATLGQVYGALDTEAAWKVLRCVGGYDNARGALYIESPDGKVILAWRGQVIPFPRCEYCNQEGHSNSSGTAKSCKVRADEVAEQRKAASRRMKERWAREKGQSVGSVPPPAEPDAEAPF